MVIAPGNPDPHYVLTLAAQGTVGAQATVTLNHPAWLANDANSSWIGVVNPGETRSSATQLLAVTVLTSLEEADLAEQGSAASAEEMVMRRAAMARDAGFDGVVASAREARAIREAIGPDFLIVTPGIRPQGASPDDQKRVVTPADAIAAGADYLVIGRPITAAPDPRAAANTIIGEIEAALPGQG
jgi:orotidine-5'-phosphate decarboxylase